MQHPEWLLVFASQNIPHQRRLYWLLIHIRAKSQELLAIIAKPLDGLRPGYLKGPLLPQEPDCAFHSTPVAPSLKVHLVRTPKRTFFVMQEILELLPDRYLVGPLPLEFETSCWESQLGRALLCSGSA